MSNYPSNQLEKFSVRLPAGMREMIRRQAEANKRSMNAEIVFRLQRAYSQPATQQEAA
ncbi:Arc family DNA-binding protein [Marinobacter sp. OP 3.4]|uniref:Arc family DNA-binding protein n=1 Tax=Marinobacter sp. OP 3.4 TaxID=3076501 RepID=UPI002E22EC88